MTETPVERLRRGGASALSDAELLALALGRGRRPASALKAAESWLGQAGSLGELLEGIDAGPTDGREVDRASLQAIREIAVRLGRAQLTRRPVLDDPLKIASFLTLRFGVADQEVVGALCLDIRHRLLVERELFRGTLRRTTVEPRQVLKLALNHHASGVVLFHTHPTGDPEPSSEDLAFTRRLKQACDLVGVELLDHLILGGLGRWTSLTRLGILG